MTINRFYSHNNNVKSQRNYPMDYAFVILCPPLTIPCLAINND